MEPLINSLETSSTPGLRLEKSLWRYRQWLAPIEEPISLGEGATPLQAFPSLGPKVYYKDERHNPTGSFKDRQASVALSYYRQQGIGSIVIASTGNAAMAYAAYGKEAGIEVTLFMNHEVPKAKVETARRFGAKVIRTKVSYDETKKLAAFYALENDLHFDEGVKAQAARESMKTISFEIAEQLALKSGKHGLLAPDWYIQAVSGGLGPVGVALGFKHLYDLGLIEKLPRLGLVQASGCAPMARSFAKGINTLEPLVPSTTIVPLATANPATAYPFLFDYIQTNGGHILSVDESTILSTQSRLAKENKLLMQDASATAFAGFEKFRREAIIGVDEIVVINCSGGLLNISRTS